MTVNALDKSTLSKTFGFHCLHYSVSEGCKSFNLPIHNRSGNAGSVWVRTVNDTATAGEDYYPVDKELVFKAGEDKIEVQIGIIDDDDWEPDEDFFVELLDSKTMEALEGADTKCRVTIIDDDKPGELYFESKETIKVLSNEDVAIIKVLRKNGSDGIVAVDFSTV